MTLARAATLPAFVAQLRVVVFDLDGTLVDSSRDITASVNAALAEMGRPALSFRQVASFVGNGVTVLVRRAVEATGGGSDAEIARAEDLMLRHYEQHPLAATRLYPGVAELLPPLAARYELAVLTNKPEAPARDILTGLGVAGYFAAIHGGDSFAAKKPDPVGLRAILGPATPGAAAAPAEALMVGDSIIDIQTGRAAGTWTCVVSYSFTPRDWPPGMADWEIAAFQELRVLLAAP